MTSRQVGVVVEPPELGLKGLELPAPLRHQHGDGLPGLERHRMQVPGLLSLAAVGSLCGGRDLCPCSGYYVDCAPLAQAVIGMLRDNPPTRPTTLWLAGEFIDRGTLAPAAVPDGQSDPRVYRFGDAVA